MNALIPAAMARRTMGRMLAKDLGDGRYAAELTLAGINFRPLQPPDRYVVARRGTPRLAYGRRAGMRWAAV